MSITLETDLKEFLIKLGQKLDKLEQKIDNVQKEVTEIKISQIKLDRC